MNKVTNSDSLYLEANITPQITDNKNQQLGRLLGKLCSFIKHPLSGGIDFALSSKVRNGNNVLKNKLAEFIYVSKNLDEIKEKIANGGLTVLEANKGKVKNILDDLEEKNKNLKASRIDNCIRGAGSALLKLSISQMGDNLNKFLDERARYKDQKNFIAGERSQLELESAKTLIEKHLMAARTFTKV